MAQLHGDGFAEDRAVGGDIGIGQNIQDEGNGDAVNDIPGVAEEIFSDGIETGADRVI